MSIISINSKSIKRDYNGYSKYLEDSKDNQNIHANRCRYDGIHKYMEDFRNSQKSNSYKRNYNGYNQYLEGSKDNQNIHANRCRYDGIHKYMEDFRNGQKSKIIDPNDVLQLYWAQKLDIDEISKNNPTPVLQADNRDPALIKAMSDHNTPSVLQWQLLAIGVNCNNALQTLGFSVIQDAASGLSRLIGDGRIAPYTTDEQIWQAWQNSLGKNVANTLYSGTESVAIYMTGEMADALLPLKGSIGKGLVKNSAYAGASYGFNYMSMEK